MKLEFSCQIFKKFFQVSNFMKFRSLKDYFFYKGERTNIMKHIVAFRNFTKEPNQAVTWR